MTKDEEFMQRALDLASLGAGQVSPNPMVGCLIVYEGKVIGEGWHQKYGGPHAEPNAIHDVADKSLIKYSTVYVTLEPCTHYGKTPPCADLLIQYMPKRVVICNADPNPLVAGKGISRLQEMNISVDVGILATQGLELNRRFFTFMKKKRPYILLKWAQTADGFIARRDYDSKWISGEKSRDLVHTWRAEEDAILVGTRTALYDNPKLNVRNGAGKDPIRLVVDKELKLPSSHFLFDQTQTTLVYNQEEDRSEEYLQYVKLDFDQNILPQLMADLYKRKVGSVMVEGGADLLSSFIELGLWDEARIFTSATTFGSGIDAPTLPGFPVKTELIQEDRLEVYSNMK